MKRNNRLEIALVEWLDAAYAPGQIVLEEAIKTAGVLTYTAGILIRDDNEAITLAHDYYDLSEEYLPAEVRHRSTIPRVLVKRVHKWRPRK